MVNGAMTKLIALHNERVPARSRRPARQATLSLAVQRFAIASWITLCVVFWIEVARLVF